MEYSQGYIDPTLSIDKKVAIVGIGCRFPNDIKNARDFWDVISSGLDCMKNHPKERLDPSYLYPDAKLPGKIYSRAAGYLSQNVNEFDRLFFQASPEEANHMDPQLRLLLEVVWESLTDYGVNVADLRQSNTGVYVGVMTKEYSFLLGFPDDNINQYTASGNSSNMMSNRISYHFDFQGPSVTYDTACSSSLYAIHYACEAIRHGDCNLALAGGVNLLLLPSMFITLCQAGMLSRDGRCKSFDRSADGYARGDGAGILVLKPLKEAICDGDRIYAVIRGGALNNDGKTSGITTPSVQAQMLLLKRAYEIANVSPQEVPYVEAHGTGTQAGDKAEATALGSIMGSDRGDNHPPLIVGSVKSNFGHTEGAAGVAGIIKTALILQKKQIPKLVNFQSENENVTWDKFEIIFPKQLMRWPAGSKHIAGCSGFGFGGANAHLVLEAAPNVSNCSKPSHDYLPTLLLLSAATIEALDQFVKDWVNFLSDPSNDDDNFRDIVHTAATRATHHPYRLAICSESLQQSIKVLKDRQISPVEVKSVSAEGRIQSVPMGQQQKLVFVFSGMGTQWWGMGRHLMKSDAVFRRTIMEADGLLKEFGAKWSLKDMLTKEIDKEKINNTEIAQPSICALQIALAEVYRQMGILPHAVIGHSVGEVAAACTAGYITFRNAMKLIFIRGKTLQLTTGKGTMAAILRHSNEVREKISEPEFRGKVDIACVNSPTQTVISGDVDAVTTIVNHFKNLGARCVLLKVQNAFHSFQQEEIKTKFLKSTDKSFLEKHTHYGTRKCSPRQVPMVSTVSGKFLTVKELNDNQYWWRNVRQTVEFEKSLRKLFEQGYNVFLEIGPHPSLASAIKSTMAAFSRDFDTLFHEEFAVLGSLRRPADLMKESQDKNDILLSVAKLYVQGYPLNLDMLFPNEPFNVVSLPTYPWQRRNCTAITEAAKKLLMTPRLIHPLLGEPLEVFTDGSDSVKRKAWKSSYNRSSLPWLPHHKIGNVIVLPGAAYIEIMLNVAKKIYESINTVTLENVHFNKFHYSPECKGEMCTTTVGSNESNRWLVTVKTYSESNATWAENATCNVTVAQGSVFSSDHVMEVNDIQGRCKLHITADKFYKRLAENGVEIGNLFGCISHAYYNDEILEGLVYASLPETIENETNDFVVHPALLDAAFQLFVGFSFVKKTNTSWRNVEVPKSVRKITVKGHAPSKIVIHGELVIEDSKESVNLTIAHRESRKIFAKFEDVQFAALGPSKDDDCVQVWTNEWVPLSQSEEFVSDHVDDTPAFTPHNKESFLIIPDQVGITEVFVDSLCEANISKDHIQIHNTSKDTNTTFQHPGGQNENVVALTFLNESEVDSLSCISREQFVRSQVNDPVSLIKLIIDFNSKHDHDNFSVWIITKGAAKVCSSDVSVNPLMSNGYSIAMTFMNEYPDLFVATIDLPHNQTTTDSVRWLTSFFLKPERSENCLALRSGSAGNGSEFEIFALRLTLMSSSDLYLSKRSDKWMIDLSEVNQKNQKKFIKPIIGNSLQKVVGSTKTSNVSVQVKAITKQSRKSISKPTDCADGYFFGGTILEHEMIGTSLKNGCNVVGYCASNIVTPIVKTEVTNMAQISSDINLSEALFVVQTYFPLYLALQVSFSTSRNPTVMLTSENVNIHLPFAKQIASCKGIKVIIYVRTAANQLEICSEHDNVEIATENSLHTVAENDSVEILLLSPDVTLGHKESHTLFKKVRFYGTIVSLDGTPVNSDVVKSRQIGVRIIEPKYIWGPETSQMAIQLIDSLFKMFFTNGARAEAINQLVETVRVDETEDYQDFHGKILLTHPTENVPFSFDNTEHLFNADPLSSYLVVGGTKGIGFEIVRWLVSHGAKCVYVAGRNRPEASILEELDKWRFGSINVEVIQCDVSNEQQVEKMLVDIRDRHEFPLVGIFHCAAVFDDQRLVNMTEEKWGRVFLPKAYGFLILHQLTTKLDLHVEVFVAISSMVQFLGNDGQGNYCGANFFLSSVCQERRLLGLPANVIAPGAISKVGFAARGGLDRMWEGRGLKSLHPSEVTASLSWSLVTDCPLLGLTGALDFDAFFKGKSELFRCQAKKNRFSVFKKEFTKEKYHSALENESNRSLLSLDLPSARAFANEFLVGFLKQRMGITEDISTEQSLSSLGFDSAMSWELSGLIRSKFSIVVTSVELLNDSATISKISSLMLNRANNQSTRANGTNTRNVASSNTLWLSESCEIKTSRADLICFPPTGKGPTLFVEWGEIFALQGIRVVVVQLPGWEGRENERASHDLSYLVRALSSAILSRSRSSRVAFFGSGIGALLAFETARYLQAEHNVNINHIYICGWYPPSTPYPYSKEMAEQDKKLFDINFMDETRIGFLDNRDIRQTLTHRNAFLNVKASESICKSYEYVMSKPLQCNMTIFSGVRDPILTQKVVGKWKNEVSFEKQFDNVTMSTDHKLLRNEKSNKKIASHVSRSLLKEIPTYPFRQVEVTTNE